MAGNQKEEEKEEEERDWETSIHTYTIQRERKGEECAVEEKRRESSRKEGRTRCGSARRRK